MRREKPEQPVFRTRGKLFKIPLWQKMLVLLALILPFSQSISVHAIVLQHNKKSPYIQQNQPQSIWPARLGRNKAATRTLVEFNKNQFSLLQDALGNVSVESLQFTALDPENYADDPPENLVSLNTHLVLDALSNSAALRTIYFDSRQLRFSFKLSLMNLIGDDLLKEELAENKRRQVEDMNRRDTPYTSDAKSVKLVGEKGLLESLRDNMKFFSFIIFLTLGLLYIFLRFFSNRI